MGQSYEESWDCQKILPFFMYKKGVWLFLFCHIYDDFFCGLGSTVLLQR